MAIPVHTLQFFQQSGNPTFIGAYEWGGKSGVGHPGFVDGPGGSYAFLTSKYGTRAGFGPATRPLNDIFYPQGFRNSLQPYSTPGLVADTKLELPDFRCPADAGPPRAAHCPDWVNNPGRSSYDHFGTSYAANVFMTSVSFGQLTSNSPYLRPFSRIPNPARTIHYEENIGRWAWACRREIEDCTWIGAGVSPGPTMHLDGWHGKAWTFARSFVDSHVAVQKIYNEDSEDAQGYATHYRNELVFPDNPDLQTKNRCIIVRGDGWQKDTLPSPPIATGISFGGNGRPSYESCVQTQLNAASTTPSSAKGGQ